MEKILNLILYNDSNEYKEMRELLRFYLKKIGMKYYFYCYKENIKSEYEIEDDMLYIKGKETYLPGILEKTIKAIEIVKDYDFKYLIRTNISTITNFRLLVKYLEKNHIDYGGTSILNLTWLDPQCGINDGRYYGTKYIHGTGIIMSKNMVNTLIKNKNEINYSVIDDVSLGLFFKKYVKEIKGMKDYYVHNAKNGIKGKIFYRNKHNNRKNDIINMKKIIEYILSEQNKYDKYDVLIRWNFWKKK